MTTPEPLPLLRNAVIDRFRRGGSASRALALFAKQMQAQAIDVDGASVNCLNCTCRPTVGR